MARVVLFVAVFLYRTIFAIENSVTPQEIKVLHLPGDLKNCTVSKSSILYRFKVLPGSGWDNLRNVHAGQIVSYNYFQCRTIGNGRFLIPDSANIVPLKQSKVETLAEIIDDWTKYTSATCRSINADTEHNLPQAAISGQFSRDFQQMKSNQINDHSLMARVQLRYVRYKITLQPDSPLHPSFKNRLLSIAATLQKNEPAYAQYECHVLIRDFGTHVVTSVDAGAALVQEDQLDRNFVKKHGHSKTMISSVASASFLNNVHCDTSYTTKNMTQLVEEYRKSRTISKLLTYGESLSLGVNCPANNWSAIHENDLVAIDRSGDPVSFLITPVNLPELPTSTVHYLQYLVSKSIELYYEYNTYRGCTTLQSTDFNPIANIDDGLCNTEVMNVMMFGGIFQTCSQANESDGEDMCSELKLSQVNPKTGQHSCSSNYQAVKLHTASIVRSSNRTRCRSCWLFRTCCETYLHYSRAKHTMYWCAAKGPVSEDSGYLFGGIFTNHVVNPVTGGYTCPKRFYARQLSIDLFVCISDDFRQGSQYSIPFAGFISCNVGNPLDLESQQCGLLEKDTPTLTVFYRNSGPYDWPKHCPDGFSKHLAYVVQQCSIHYCAKMNFLTGMKIPTIRRPPFSSGPIGVGIPDGLSDLTGRMWMENEKDILLKTDSPNVNTTNGTGIGTYLATVAIIVVFIFLIMFCVNLKR